MLQAEARGGGREMIAALVAAPGAPAAKKAVPEPSAWAVVQPDNMKVK